MYEMGYPFDSRKLNMQWPIWCRGTDKTPVRDHLSHAASEHEANSSNMLPLYRKIHQIPSKFLKNHWRPQQHVLHHVVT
ncbi:hypothetical protein B9J78_03855 [bacterium Unc6]|nr:hypothetical protein [bacterium Unc6]MBT9130911.1 hypothetical protein [Candidatus Psychracetigena formicireducens]